MGVAAKKRKSRKKDGELSACFRGGAVTKEFSDFSSPRCLCIFAATPLQVVSRGVEVKG